ncbi:MAG: hypothetical protein JRI80_10290 [Deltaproteobacteria bacterium]|nr:hypothetical protein [Deltaproteobacteria bacterium]
MRRAGSAFLGMLLGFFVLLSALPGICSKKAMLPYPDVPRMPPGQCLKQLGKIPPPVIIDVRLTSQFKESLQKLPGAVHEDPENVQSWAHKYKKGQTIILY